MKGIGFYSAVLAGKAVRRALIFLKREATSLPGKVALRFDPGLLAHLEANCRSKILVTGTNGKTTTSNLIHHILRSAGKSVLANLEGSNMKQGLASIFLKDIRKKYDWGVFEVDEGSFPEVAKVLRPDYVLVTNFFRDQLDRYGEIELTVSRVRKAVSPLKSRLILNADDPFTAQFGRGRKNSITYGVAKNSMSRKEPGLVETRFCPLCGRELSYAYYNYGQLGSFRCSCSFRSPVPDYAVIRIRDFGSRYSFDMKASGRMIRNLSFAYTGLYNMYNCCAAVSFCLAAGVSPGLVQRSLESFDYRRGRMEEMAFPDKKVKLILAKNPVGLTQVVRSIASDRKKKSVLFLLNDNIADGRDVSWIWDADLGLLQDASRLSSLYFSGKRGEDMALRVKYAGLRPSLIRSVDGNIAESLKRILKEKVETVYVIPTYTALALARKTLLSLLGRCAPAARQEMRRTSGTQEGSS